MRSVTGTEAVAGDEVIAAYIERDPDMLFAQCKGDIKNSYMWGKTVDYLLRQIFQLLVK